MPGISWSDVDGYAKSSFKQGAVEAGNAFLGPVGGAAAGAVAGPLYEGIKDVGAAIVGLFTSEAPPPILIHVDPAEVARMQSADAERGARGRAAFAAVEWQWLKSTQALETLRQRLGLSPPWTFPALVNVLKSFGLPDLQSAIVPVSRSGGWRNLGGWTPFAGENIPASDDPALWQIWAHGAHAEPTLGRINGFLLALEAAKNRVALAIVRDAMFLWGRLAALQARADIERLVANVNLVQLAFHVARPNFAPGQALLTSVLLHEPAGERILRLLDRRQGPRSSLGLRMLSLKG